ncbi:MAG: hypothetical protein ACUVXJ_18690 [Phycisphaerae bacterium]
MSQRYTPVFLIISCQLVFSCADRLFGADCNSNGIVDECDISCGETGGPCDLPDCGLSSDCNMDGIPDDCEVSGEVCSFPVSLAGNTTGAADAIFTGPPDDVFYGLGGQLVTYRLGCLLIDGPGADFTVYEVDSGAAEFSSIDVLVSQDGVQFITAKSSEQQAVSIPGDEIHGSNTFARSYDLTATGLSLARFIRIDGNGTGAAGASTGFDLDAIGVVNGVSDCNTNGVPDDCDADPADPDGNGQTSNDCNANSIPDECEPDCNGNGVPDDCDLDTADPDGNGQTSNDCDGNAVPDECDPDPADPDRNGLVSRDCNSNVRPDECEADCNTNGVPDDCDVNPSDPDGNEQVSPDCNSNAKPDECENDCNVNGIPDDCDVDPADPDEDGLISPDCNGNTLPDECESGEAPFVCRFPTALAENTTGGADAIFTGPPDDVFYGLGGQVVTYSFDCLVFDGPGADVTVYEADGGSAEFGLMDVLVSMDGLLFISVKQTEGSAIRIPGDESYTNISFARSYDLGITGWPWIRFLRIDGNGTGAAGGSTGFDLDAVGAIHIPLDCDANGIPDACDPDTDVDGVVDGCDFCPNTVSGLSVDSSGCPPLIACDDDRDGDVDTADMAAFESRVSGPGVFCIGDCTRVDFDADFDVDQADFAVCQTCFSGVGVPAAADCLR